MADKPLDRRTFIKLGIAAAAAGGLAAKAAASRLVPGSGASPVGPAFDPKGLPTRILGRTGVAVPILSFGAGSRFLTVKDPAKAEEILRHALDQGVFYWDTADNYVAGDILSEERLAAVLKDRRREVFLATKTHARDHDGVLRAVEESLRRLGTDHLDLYQAHSIQTPAVVDEIGAPNGAWKALLRLREEKVTRFLGFSGHASAPAMAAMVKRFDFDSMLIALNHYQERQGDLERDAVPAAAERGLGVAVIKVIRPREKIGRRHSRGAHPLRVGLAPRHDRGHRDRQPGRARRGHRPGQGFPAARRPPRGRRPRRSGRGFRAGRPALDAGRLSRRRPGLRRPASLRANAGRDL